MSRLSPVVRVVLTALVVSALAGAVAGWLHVSSLRNAGRAAARAALADRVALATAAMEPSATDRAALLEAFQPYVRVESADQDAPAYALVTAEGRLLATSSTSQTRGVPWETVLRPGAAGRPTDARPPDPAGTPHAVVRQTGGDGEIVWVAQRPLGSLDVHLVGVRPAYTLSAAQTSATLTAFASLWGLLAAVLILGGYWAGPWTLARLARAADRLGRGEGAPEAAVLAARPSADVLAPVAKRLQNLTAAVAGARDHVAALYQVNPHYVVLASMNGRLVEANPAFYAVTGLAPDALHGAPLETLAEAFPLGPLMELAERSLAEGASIGGIEYAILDCEGNGRPVEVSLRAFQQGDTALVLVQATDLAVRRTLERRVAAFSDSLDLMVDQRVRQLAAGQQSLRRLLDAAGVAVASFDASGTTRRWSGAMQTLSGCVAADVPHFHGAAAALGLADDARDAFGRWFWGASDVPFEAVHAGPDGRPRTMLWRKVDADRAGSADHRTLVGMELPDGSLSARLADAALHAAAGDGAVAQIADA